MGTKLLAEAASVFREASEVYTRNESPQTWARTQMALAASLHLLAARLKGEEGKRHLVEAVSIYREVLEVYTREAFPQQWAQTMCHLGCTIKEQAHLIEGSDGNQLLGEAILVLKASLEECVPDKYMSHWIRVTNMLGLTYRILGARTPGPKGDSLLFEGGVAFKSILSVCTREQFPESWATTHRHLGYILHELGWRTDGEKGVSLLEEAVADYLVALDILTLEVEAQEWARTHHNLGVSYKVLGIRMRDAIAKHQYFTKAETAFRQAIQVRTKEVWPYDWNQSLCHFAELFEAWEKWDSALTCWNQLKDTNPLKAMPRIAHIAYHHLHDFESAHHHYAFLLQNNYATPTDSLKYLESHFTTARFAEGIAQIQAFHDGRGCPSPITQALLVPLHAGVHNTRDAQRAMKVLNTLLKEQASDFVFGHDFAPVQHFVRTSSSVESYRNWLLAYFRALGEPGRDRIREALDRLPKPKST